MIPHLTYWWRVLREAAEIWYDRDADIYAASVAYYALFSVVPLLLLLTTVIGIVFPTEYIIVQLQTWGTVFGQDMLNLLEQAARNLSLLADQFYIPLLGVIFFSGMVITTLNTLTTGLHRLWEIPHRGVRGWIQKCFHSAFFVVLLTGLVSSMLLLEQLFYRQSVMPQWLVETIATGVLFVGLVGIISFMYRLLPWESPAFSGRIIGASLAAFLFIVAKIVVAWYVSLTPFPGLFGVAGLLIVLLIWLYVIVSIIYYGAAIAHIISPAYQD